VATTTIAPTARASEAHTEPAASARAPTARRYEARSLVLVGVLVWATVRRAGSDDVADEREDAGELESSERASDDTDAEPT
jgi:hypothetical protein